MAQTAGVTSRTAPWLTAIFRLLEVVIGVLIAAAAVNKLSHPHDFLRAFYGYGLIGPPYAKWLASALMGIELWLGVALVTGLMRRPAILATQLLLALFILAQLSVVWRGMDADCGCGFNAGEPVGAMSIARTSLLLLAVSTGSIWTSIARRSGAQVASEASPAASATA